jgi:hypothetical protein
MQTSSPRGKVPQAKSGLGGDKEFFTSTSPAKAQPKQITKMIQYYPILKSKKHILPTWHFDIQYLDPFLVSKRP